MAFEYLGRTVYPERSRRVEARIPVSLERGVSSWELEKILTAEDSLLLAGMCDRCLSRLIACNRPEVWTTPCDRHRI